MEGLINIGTAIGLSSASFVAYVAWVWAKYGVLPSISNSYYKHKEKWKFFTFMTGVGLPLISSWENWMITAAGVLFMTCGLSPAYKKDDKSIQDELHAIGAMGGITLMLTSLVTEGQWWVLPAMLVPTLYMSSKKVKNHTWWTEIAAFATVGLGYLFK